MRNYRFPFITKQQILDLMEYNSERGLLWKIRRGRYALPGFPVGGKSNSQIILGGVRVYVSHIVWFIHNEWWPSERKLWIDHIDGDRENNLIENLRAVSPSENNANRSHRKNKYLPKGVGFQNKYRASIQFNGRKYFLGSFETEAEAEAAYVGASRVLHGEFSFYNRDQLSDILQAVSIISEIKNEEES